MNGIFDGLSSRAVTAGSTLGAINKFGGMSVAAGTAAAGRLAALHDSIARQAAGKAGQMPYYAPSGRNASDGYEFGKQLGAAVAAVLSTSGGQQAFGKVLDAGVAIVRDVLGIAGGGGLAAESGAGSGAVAGGAVRAGDAASAASAGSAASGAGAAGEIAAVAGEGAVAGAAATATVAEAAALLAVPLLA